MVQTIFLWVREFLSARLMDTSLCHVWSSDTSYVGRIREISPRRIREVAVCSSYSSNNSIVKSSTRKFMDSKAVKVAESSGAAANQGAVCFIHRETKL